MRRKVTKIDLIEFIKRLDTRAKKFETEKFDEIIDKAFAQMEYAFTDEDTLQVEQYIEDSVTKMSYDIERDVSYIYDAFLSEDSRNAITNTDLMIEVDPRIKGRINVDFSSQVDMYGKYSNHFGYNGTTPKTLVVKYYYIPTSEFETIYMDRDVQVVLNDALRYALYLDLHDKKYNIHMAKLEQSMASLNKEPLDFAGLTPSRRFAI